MSIVISVPPTVEPVSVPEAKEHLRLLNNEDDDYLAALIQAARLYVEIETQRSLITQTIKQYRDSFPSDDDILLERGPIQSATVTYVDSAGATQTLSTSVYDLKKEYTPARITLKSGQSWPTNLDSSGNAVCITSVCGYGVSGSFVPQTLRLAIKFLVAWWYNNRTPTNIGASITELPRTFDAIVGPYRIYVPKG